MYSENSFQAPDDDGAQVQSVLEKIGNDAAFKLLVASVKDYAIFMLDPRGYVLTWNEGAQRIKGYTEQEIVGQHFSIFYTDEANNRRHPHKELDIAGAKGRYEEEGWRVRKDGSLFWANVVITAMYQGGQLVGFGKVTRDLTERKNSEAARERVFDQVKSANDELQHLAYVISHELQEPLASMTSYSTLLSSRYEGRLGPDADDFLHRIGNGAKLTARFVDDLWTYARVTKPGSVRARISSGRILKDAKEDLSKLIEKSHCEFIHAEYRFFPTVEANKEQLLYVFKELIANAIRHYNGPDNPKIEIRSTPERKGYTFNFKDNGPGIDKFFAQQVFTIYQRLDAKPDVNGTGMGLPICKKIIEDQHSGKIGFESIHGHGSNFFFWLPEPS